MHILHYALGLPPYRSGGLTRYVVDLMQHQAQEAGHEVYLLYPGPRSLWRHSRIRPLGDFGTIKVHEILQPPLVPLLNGVARPEAITSPRRPLSREALERYFDAVRPDVVHIHTLMGLPAEFLQVSRARGIRTLFTAHDYFGLCPRAVMVDAAGGPCPGPSPEHCEICNRGASAGIMAYLHSQKCLHRVKPLLRRCLDTRPRVARGDIWAAPGSLKNPSGYARLLDLFAAQLKAVDHFHFASSVSERVYTALQPGIEGSRIPVIHAGIADHRGTRATAAPVVRLGFIGDSTAYKGYAFLRAVLEKLRGQGIDNWVLNVHGPGHEHDAPGAGISIKGAYKPQEIPEIFGAMDLLLVPSLWPETFSLVALEALSYGVPTLVHTTVGAKDLLEPHFPELVVEPDQLGPRLASLLRRPESLAALQEGVGKLDLPLDFAAHCRAIFGLYRVD